MPPSNLELYDSNLKTDNNKKSKSCIGVTKTRNPTKIQPMNALGF